MLLGYTCHVAGMHLLICWDTVILLMGSLILLQRYTYHVAGLLGYTCHVAGLLKYTCHVAETFANQPTNNNDSHSSPTA